jgi:HPr kinase/phosphorylase
MTITVKNLVGRSKVLAGSSGLDREVASPQVLSPHLSSIANLKGMASSLVHLSPSQSAYLCSLPKLERTRLVRTLMGQRPAGIVLTGGTSCAELLAGAERTGVPVFMSRDLQKLTRLLSSKLLLRMSLHGVLVQIFGLGTLLIGESAIGKSEAALDLVLRGHKLAADDIVLLERVDDGTIEGRAPEMGMDLLQIRGLGIINVRALYGESATVPSSRVGLVVELEEWKQGQHYSLVGLRERRYKILGLNVPYLKLPVKPGRNMATLIEVAARNQMLKNRGIFTARELSRTLKKRLAG